jgi:hypothetical protein
MRGLVVAVVVLCTLPTFASAGEVDRIRAHLSGALTYVQARDISQLSSSQRANRAHAIDALEHYIARGVFPRRTDDPYPGLRPRFIDDRGVHCAVGQLIAESGHAQLAREIARNYEYAYVRDIASPALLAWADEQGFTVDELARIQPSYHGPPTPDGMQRKIDREMDPIILACTGVEPPPRRLELQLVGSRDGAVDVKTTSEDAFAQCFAKAASELERGGHAYAPSPTEFRRDITIELRSPQQLLDKAITERIGYGPDCTPRPGAVPKQATIDIASKQDSLEIRVTTSPENAEVNACIADYLRPRLRNFSRHINWRKTIALSPRVTSRSVGDVLRATASHYATDCYTAEAPARVAVTAKARRDDREIAISIAGANERFSTCVAGKLQRQLRSRLSVPRDGARYFRIDTNVDASVSFPLELPSTREQRRKKARDAAKREMQELSKQKRYELN